MGAAELRLHLRGRLHIVLGRIVGGARDTASQTIYGGMRIRDVILTIGWTLTPAHRAALDTYRKRRVL